MPLIMAAQGATGTQESDTIMGGGSPGPTKEVMDQSSLMWPHVPGACASLQAAGVPASPSYVCMEVLGLQQGTTLGTLGLFIIVSEQAQLSSLLIYVTPTEASRYFLQLEWKDNTGETLLFLGRLLLAKNPRKVKKKI